MSDDASSSTGSGQVRTVSARAAPSSRQEDHSSQASTTGAREALGARSCTNTSSTSTACSPRWAAGSCATSEQRRARASRNCSATGPQALGNSLNVEETLQVLACELQKLIRFDAIAIYLLREGKL